jgi:hypothetical protein
MTIGEWLVSHGLEINRSAIGACAMHLRRRMPNRRQAAVTASGAIATSTSTSTMPTRLFSAASRRSHRRDCTCVICKQARRRGGTSAISSTVGTSAPGAAGAPASLGAEDGADALRPARPPFRTGKHAYLDSLPYLSGGPNRPGSDPFHRPASRAWHPSEWVIFSKMREDASAAVAAAVAVGDVGDKPQALAGAVAAAAPQMAPKIDDKLLRALEAPSRGSPVPVVVRQGMLGKLGLHRHRTDDPGSWRLAVTSLHDKVMQCDHTERERVTFNKSGIHGWGMTVLQDIPQARDQSSYT